MPRIITRPSSNQPLTLSGIPHTSGMTEKRVSVFPISTPDGAVEYEELANSKKAKVLEEQTMLLKDGTVLRVVDFLEADTSKPVRPVYTAPVN